MPLRHPALRRERLRLYLRIVAAGVVVGAVYGPMISHDSPLVGLAIGIFNGALIAAAIGGVELFLLRARAGSLRRLLRLPFVVVVALKTLLYGAIVTLVPALHLFGLLLPDLLRESPVDMRTELLTVGFSISVTLIAVIILQAAALVGGRTLLDLILGRYRRPRLERRFFLFVDVVGSTPVVERLGPLEAHRLLALVFGAVAEPIAASRGEIYQYVGDEIVVTWREAEGQRDARPARCFFEMQAALADAAERFRLRFGAVPELRGALHLGEVVAGEVGEQRRAIVYHGDAMNTASRLEQATRELGRRFIVSATALQALGPLPGFRRRALGALALRGRKEPVLAWALERGVEAEEKVVLPREVAGEEGPGALLRIEQVDAARAFFQNP